MINLPLSKVKPGMVTAQSIYNESGGSYLTKGTELTESYIEELQKLGVSGIHVLSMDTKNPGVTPPEGILTEKTRAMAIQHVYHVFEDVRKKGTFDIGPLRASAASIVNDVTLRRRNLVQLTDLRTHDMYTFAHSVNVAMLSGILASLLNMDKNHIVELTLGALLHDIGKVDIPKEVLNKPGRLDDKEFALIKTHPTRGMERIKKLNLPDSKLLSIVALEHHEHLDGRGYPQGLKGDAIHPYGRIAAIADVYDALTSERAYKRPYTPAIAYKLMKFCSPGQFSPTLLNLFFKNVAIYPVGTVIKTNYGYGIVKSAEFGRTDRPVVAIFADGDGKPVKTKVIDFSEERDAKVESVLNGIELFHFVHELHFDPAERLVED